MLKGGDQVFVLGKKTFECLLNNQVAMSIGNWINNQELRREIGQEE